MFGPLSTDERKQMNFLIRILLREEALEKKEESMGVIKSVDLS